MGRGKSLFSVGGGRTILSGVVLTAILASVCQAEIIYVDDGAPLGGDGTTGPTAYRYLQDALAEAGTNGLHTEIRVAQGVYVPDRDEGGIVMPGDRTAYFLLPPDTEMYGGYAGIGEPDPDLRDITLYETVLSGDLNGNDGPDFTNNNDNSHHVVVVSSTHETDRLDGFTVSGGNADVTASSFCGAGIFNGTGNLTIANCTITGNFTIGCGGGGMYNTGSANPTIANCTFSGNSSGGTGGGLYSSNHSTPTVTNCVFSENSALYGGGLGSRVHSTTTLTNCVFVGNSANDIGGGVFIQLTEATLVNCLFIGNSATRAGGAMYNDYTADSTMTNCTFASNFAPQGRTLACDYPGTPSTVEMANCILWNGADEIWNNDASTITITYSDVQGGWPGEGNINDDPVFVDSNGPDDISGTEDDNLRLLDGSPCLDVGDNDAVPPLVTTDLDGNSRIVDGIVDMGVYEGPKQGFLLGTGTVTVPEGGTAEFTVALAMDPLGTENVSVAVESGDPDISVQSGGSLAFDSGNFSTPQTVTLFAAEDWDHIAGTALIRVTAAGVPTASVTGVEADNDPLLYVLYVDADTAPDGDGASWSQAFDNLQDALATATFFPEVEEIRMAQGTYRPAGPGGDRSATFQLIDGVMVNGGYAGFGETDPDRRDISSNVTVLSGDLNGNDGPNFTNYGENSYHVVTGSGTDATAVLDGFTITGGYADETAPDRSGSGMFIDAGSPTIANCTFSANSTPYNSGGGMGNRTGSSPILTDCTFIGNKAGSYGGALWNYDYSHPILTNCSFRDNSAIIGGGICNHYYSSPALTACVFSENSASSCGGGVYGEASSALLTNCVFQGNWAGQNGGGLQNNYYSHVTLANCLFSGNTADEHGGGIYNERSNPTLTNCTFAANSAPLGGAFGCDSYQQQNPGNIQMANCVIWDGADGIWNNDGSTITITYSDVQGGWPGEGNIDDDPVFVDSNGLDDISGTEDDNLRLLPGSPCLNSGNNAALPPTVTTDLDGHARVLCTTVDMGAYEFGIADYNCDQVVNLDDFASWEDCMTGPEAGPYDPGCEAFDFKYDQDVDLADFAAFQVLFTAP